MYTVKSYKKPLENPAILSINYDNHLNFEWPVLYYKGNDRVDMVRRQLVGYKF